MFCENCGTKNNDNDAFCAKCGNPVRNQALQTKAVYCEQCGTKNQAGDVFCVNCGGRVDDGKSPQLNQVNQYNTNQHNQNQYNQGQYNQGQYNQGQYNQSQYSPNHKNGKDEEGANVTLMILLSVCAVVLVGLIVFGAYLLFREPKQPAVEVPQVVEEPLEVQVPTQIPTQVPTQGPEEEETPVEEAQAEEEAPDEEPVVEEPTQQERQSNPQRSSAEIQPSGLRNDFVFVDSDVRLITRGELDMLTAAQIRIARNELFARRGRVFERQDMREYFNNQQWYRASVPAATFDANRGTYMNRTEIDNMNFINQYEREHGLNS